MHNHSSTKIQLHEYLVVKCCISLDMCNHFKNLNLHNKSRKIFSSDIFGLKAVFIPLCYANAVQDDIPSITIRLRLYHTDALTALNWSRLNTAELEGKLSNKRVARWTIKEKATENIVIVCQTFVQCLINIQNSDTHINKIIRSFFK